MNDLRLFVAGMMLVTIAPGPLFGQSPSTRGLDQLPIEYREQAHRVVLLGSLTSLFSDRPRTSIVAPQSLLFAECGRALVESINVFL